MTVLKNHNNFFTFLFNVLTLKKKVISSLRLHLHFTFACITGLIHAKIESGWENALSPPFKILNLLNLSYKVINKRPTTSLPLAENYLSNTNPCWGKKSGSLRRFGTLQCLETTKSLHMLSSVCRQALGQFKLGRQNRQLTFCPNRLISKKMVSLHYFYKMHILNHVNLSTWIFSTSIVWIVTSLNQFKSRSAWSAFTHYEWYVNIIRDSSDFKLWHAWELESEES